MTNPKIDRLKTKNDEAKNKAEPPNPDKTASLVVDDIVADYKGQLTSMMAEHEKSLENSKIELERFIKQSNREVETLTKKLDNQVQAAQKEIKEGMEPAEPQQETAWVKGHLVLNPQAVKNLNNMFELLKDILPEIAEALKKR